MDYSQRTPAWLVGLFVVFSLAAAATFGLFLYRHAQKAGLHEQHEQLKAEIKVLRLYQGELEAAKAPLEQQIAARVQLAHDLESDDKQTIDDVARLVASNQVSLKGITEDIDKEIATAADKLKEMKERRGELAQEETRAHANERDFDDRRAQLRKKIEDLKQEVEGIKKKGRAEDKGLDDRIVQLEDRVRELIRQREIDSKEIHSKGEIVQASAAEGFVVINRGQKHNLRKGTRFTVFNRRGGKLIVKGAIEITRVEEMISVGRVLEETDANDPFIPNDSLFNPVYDPEKVKGFAIRGDFSQFSKDELRRFITESGGRYDEELSVNTDYLVAGERSDAALQQAIKLGISILSEEQLIASQLFHLGDFSRSKQ